MTSTLAPVLSIAGSDSSGGAGIQADLKTMLANGVFGMTAIAALTAQNTTGVTMVTNTPPEMLAAQIDAVFEDIPPVAVKIGMVSSVELINVIADRLIAHDATNIVLDPVMVATSGAKLIEGDAIAALTSEAVPAGHRHHAEYAGDPGAVRAGRRTGCRRDRLREWRKHLQ